jgi:hypothetical protein
MAKTSFKKPGAPDRGSGLAKAPTGAAATPPKKAPTPPEGKECHESSTTSGEEARGYPTSRRADQCDPAEEASSDTSAAG